MSLISICERQFVSNCIIQRHKRVDGRELTQGRTLDIVFGKERGCCMVLQGNTRVLAQVSCTVSKPRVSAPNEGTIHINYNLSAMASLDAKNIPRYADEVVDVQRSLDRCVKFSNCIDLESLCIVSESKVWIIRVDVHVHNDDGNLAECSSIAVISALAHFRRPEVTVIGTDVTVHSIEEREPVALNLHHMPIIINLALFDKGKHIIVDPNKIEEKVCEGVYVMGMNAHQEICFVHRRGILALHEEEIKRCEDVAISRAQELTQIIRAALDDDAYKRATNAAIGFTHLIKTSTILEAKCQMPEKCLVTLQNMPPEVNDIENVECMKDNNIDNSQFESSEDENDMIIDISRMTSETTKRSSHILQKSDAAVSQAGCSKWGEETSDEASEEVVIVNEVLGTKPNASIARKILRSDSEEEVVYINEEQIDKKSSNRRGWFVKDPFA